MTLQEVSDFGMQMRRAQAAEGKPWEQTSSALGGFQITGSNVRAYAAVHGLDMATTRFTPELQQAMAAEIAGRQGSSAWEGFRTHPELRQAFDLTGGGVPRVQLAAVPAAAQEMAAAGNSKVPGNAGTSSRSLATAASAREAGDISSRDYDRPRDREGEAAAPASLAERIAANPTAGAAPPVELAAMQGAAGQMAANRSDGAGGGDSSHTVEVRFVDAPAGLRTGISRADGPARLAVRTNYAMAAPF